MLASLLPGLREVRAPLAAGYLWLVVGWLLLHDRVDKGASASGAVDALAELRDAIGLGGIAAAATFVAYVLGALWEPISVKAAEVLWRVWSSIWSWRARFGERNLHGLFRPDDLPAPVANLSLTTLGKLTAKMAIHRTSRPARYGLSTAMVARRQAHRVHHAGHELR